MHYNVKVIENPAAEGRRMAVEFTEEIQDASKDEECHCGSVIYPRLHFLFWRASLISEISNQLVLNPLLH